MTVNQIADVFEIKFWNIIIPFMEEKGPIMKIIQWFKQLIYSKAGFLIFLFIIWSAVGFIFGLTLGRVIWMLQLL